MKKIKKVVALLSIVSLLIATAFSASAVEANASYDPETNHATVLHNENQVIPVAGTTQLSQDEYKRTWASLTDNAGTAAEIQATCELFISSIYASRRDSDYNCTTFTVQSIRNEQVDSTIAYIESQNQYQREIADICDFKINSDSIEFENFSGVLTGNTCTAEIGVHYCYEMEGAFEDTFYLNCVYYLTLEKINGNWGIVTAKTSMPNEQADGFVYDSFDAHAAALAVVGDHDFSTMEKPTNTNNTATTTATYQTTSYSSTAAVNYAKQYYNKTNSLFGASSSNCQNFASQCVWAGLLSGCGASGTSTTAFPAVSTAWTGTNSTNVWCRNQYTTYYGDKYWLNWGWDNVNGFLKIIWLSDHTISGPQGYYWLGLAKACVGDVIIWDTAGTRSVDSGTYDHAMVVTRTTGTVGSRGVSNFCIAANSSSTTSAYMPLAQYCSYSASCFATAHITGGYYYI